MKLSEWPSRLRQWLSLRVSPDSWLTVSPLVGQVSAFVPPVSEISYELEDSQVIGILDQLLMMQATVGASDYESINLEQLYALYQGLAMELVLRGDRIAPDIRKAQGRRLPVPDPVSIEPFQGSQGWTITLLWSLQIEFIADSETFEGVDLGTPSGPQTPDTPFDTDRVTAGLWKALSAGGAVTDATRDYPPLA